MAKNVIINVKIDTKDGVKSIGDVNKEVKTTLSTMREMEEAAALITEKLKDVEVGSEAYKKLSKELINVNTNLKNQELALEALDHEQVASEIKSVTGGLTDMATGLAMVGVSGKSMEKIMQTMAKFEGLNKIVTGGMEAFQSFKKLSGAFETVKTSFMALDKAMKFSVIGIIALAIGAVIYALSSFTSSSDEATESVEDLNTALEGQKTKLIDLKNEYILLNNEVNKYIVAQQEAWQSTIDYTKSYEELVSIAKLYGQEIDITKLSNQELTEAISELEGANKTMNQSTLDQIRSYKDVKDAAFQRINSLRDEVALQEKVVAGTKQFETVTSTANGVTIQSTHTTKKYQDEMSKLLKLRQEQTQAIGLEKTATKALEAAKLQLYDLDNQQGGSLISETIAALQAEAKARGIVSGDAANELAIKQKLADERRKEIEQYRRLLDILDEMNFLRREIAIREAEEGIDLAEMKNLEILAREKAFLDMKKQIQRDETLSTKQKNEYILLLEQQYLLDVQDINNKFREEEKKNVLAHRQFIYDQYITAEETEAINAEKMLADLQFEKELELLKAEQIPNEEERQAKILEIKKSYLQKETDALLLSLAKQVDARTAVYETDLINAGENLVEKEKIEAEYNADIADMYHNTELSIQNLQNDSIDELEKTLAQKVEAVGKWVTAIGTLIQQATTLLQTYWSQQAETEKRTRDYAFTEAKEQLAAQLANEEISRKEHDNMLRELDQQKREEEKKAALKAFRQNKALNIVNATMSAAQATIAAFAAGASLGPAGVVMGPVMAGIAAALGVAQIAVVASQKFTAKRGGVVPGAPSKHDSVDAKLAPGETVINSESSMMFPQLLSAINKAGGGISLAPELPINTASSNAVFAQNAPQSVKAYVVESEMTDSQRKINRIQRGAKFSRAN